MQGGATTSMLKSIKKCKNRINWAAIAALAAVAAAIFAWGTWYNAEETLKYAKAKETPDLWMVKDKFVYGEYAITHLSQWDQPQGIPQGTLVLQHFPVKEIETGNTLNRICAIVNSSTKYSSNDHIDNYSGLFGELYFQNRGEIPIKEIEITKCDFKMRESNDYQLEDFSLSTQGKLDVDIGRDSQLIVLLGYLYDNDEHLLCDPKYVSDGLLDLKTVQKKKMFDDQLRCYLPVMIDLYDELSLIVRFTAQDGSVYEQEHKIKITLSGDGGMYTPTSSVAQLITK